MLVATQLWMEMVILNAISAQMAKFAKMDLPPLIHLRLSALQVYCVVMTATQ